MGHPKAETLKTMFVMRGIKGWGPCLDEVVDAVRADERAKVVAELKEWAFGDRICTLAELIEKLEKP